MANLGLLLRGQPQPPDFNYYIIQFRPEGHQQPHNEVGSLRLAETPVGPH